MTAGRIGTNLVNESPSSVVTVVHNGATACGSIMLGLHSWSPYLIWHPARPSGHTVPLSQTLPPPPGGRSQNFYPCSLGCPLSQWTRGPLRGTGPCALGDHMRPVSLHVWLVPPRHDKGSHCCPPFSVKPGAHCMGHGHMLWQSRQAPVRLHIIFVPPHMPKGCLAVEAPFKLPPTTHFTASPPPHPGSYFKGLPTISHQLC